MIILSIILFLLVFVLLLFKKVSIRLIYSREFRIELDFYPFLFILTDFKRQKKKSNIKFRFVVKRLLRLINSSSVKVRALPPRADNNSQGVTYGIFYSFIYPILAYLSTSTKALSTEKKQDASINTLDITLDIRLYLLAKEALLFALDIVKEKISGKYAQRFDQGGS